MEKKKTKRRVQWNLTVPAELKLTVAREAAVLRRSPSQLVEIVLNSFCLNAQLERNRATGKAR